MPNALSYLMLALSIPAGIAAFLVLRPTTAAPVVMLSFALFLPEVVTLDAPGLPGLGKYEAASIACLLGMLVRGRTRLREARPFRGPEVLTLGMVACSICTVATNGDTLVYGSTRIPGMTLWDVVGEVYRDVLWFTVPFLVGRASVPGVQELRRLLSVIVMCGVIYTPLLFIELQLSPQLHAWVYGFHQHSFAQTMRGGGFRPTVFMPHGLPVALFMAWSALAAVTLARARRSLPGAPAPLVAGYLWAFLVACKSLGALLFGAFATAVTMMMPPRAVARIAFVGALVVLAYPACRNYHLFPVDQALAMARAVSDDRARSLDYRFQMEELLTQHTAERPWFGWGGWGRHFVYSPESGQSITVSDGYWIIVISVRGIVGFAFMFPLLLWPLLVLPRRLRRVEVIADRKLVTGLASIVLIGVVDLIPNGLFTPLVVFFGGALYGAARGMASTAAAPSTDVIPAAS